MRRGLSVLALLMLSACADPGPPPGGSVAELQHIDETVGTGAIATGGSDVTVHYTGWLYDEKAQKQRGEKFDSSVDRAEPFRAGLRRRPRRADHFARPVVRALAARLRARPGARQ